MKAADEFRTLYAATMTRLNASAPGELLARMKRGAPVVAVTPHVRRVCTRCQRVRPLAGELCSRCRKKRPPACPLCTQCSVHRVRKQPVCSLCRQRAQRRKQTRVMEPTVMLTARVRELCVDCKQVTPQRGARCYQCARIVDDDALADAGYGIVDCRHVRDPDEGHVMLRSVALARIAGRDAR